MGFKYGGKVFTILIKSIKWVTLLNAFIHK